MSLATGAKLGPYEISCILGAGGMGEVYRASDSRVGRDVAIKVSGQEFTERFEQEARTIASLNHPNICTLYDVGPNYLVMELVDGPTLAERIKESPMSAHEALHIARQIADALEAAHERGITHRDLKPANVKVKPDGLVKVLDFGLAKMGGSAVQTEDSPTIATLTHAGVIIGTPAYMSPEQAKGKPVDKRSDIWAFGVLLYEMLTGDRLFHGETFSDTLAAVLRQDIDWRPIPSHVQPLLKKCLERDPRLRLRDIGDAWSFLQLHKDSPSPPKTRTWLPWGVASVAGIALVGALFALWPGKPTDRPLVRLSVDLGPDLSVTANFTAALTPDGTKVLYRVQTGEGKYSMALRSFDQKNRVLVRGTEDVTLAPFFSPDGQWIGFNKGGQIQKVPVEGGVPIEMANIGGGGQASWGKDGYIVTTPGPSNGLIRFPDRPGAMPEPLTELAPGEITHRFPQVLPDAHAVLFTAAPSYGSFERATIQVVPVSTHKPQVLVTDGFAGRYVPSNGTRGHLIYVHQGTLFAIPFDPVRLKVLAPKAVAVVEEIGSNPTGGAPRFDFSTDPAGPGTFVYQEGSTFLSKWQMLWLDSSGNLTPLKLAAGNYPGIRLSPDGKRVAFTANTGRGFDIFVYDTVRDRQLPLTSSGQDSRDPVWAPDQNHIAFSTPDGIWWTRADGGSEPQLLLKTASRATPTSFSKNGEFLAYSQASVGTSNDIWMLPLDLSDPDHPKTQTPQVFLHSTAGENVPAFSPDGHWVAYASSGPEGDRLEANRNVWVTAFPGPGSNKWPVSTDGGTTPIWSQTSSQLFFEKPGGVIMAADYVVKGDSFTVEKVRQWSDKTAFEPGQGRNLDLARDGKFLIFDRPVGAPKPITHLTFLLNFFDELRRRAPEVSK